MVAQPRYRRRGLAREAMQLLMKLVVDAVPGASPLLPSSANTAPGGPRCSPACPGCSPTHSRCTQAPRTSPGTSHISRHLAHISRHLAHLQAPRTSPGTSLFCAKIHTDNAPSLRLFATLGFSKHAHLPGFGQIELVAAAAEAVAAAGPLRMRRTQASAAELRQRVPPDRSAPTREWDRRVTTARENIARSVSR